MNPINFLKAVIVIATEAIATWNESSKDLENIVNDIADVLKQHDAKNKTAKFSRKVKDKMPKK